MRTKPIKFVLNLVVIVALTLSWLPVTSAAAISAPHAPAAQMLPVEPLLNLDGTLNPRAGASGALDLRGWNVTLDSARGPILTHNTSAPAESNANTWSALTHNGLTGAMVNALAVIGSDLYVGGSFTQTADGAVTNLNNIARYSGGAWSALDHTGLDNIVFALAVMGSDLYVGGLFKQTADGTVTHLNNIARYSGGGTWSALTNNGLDNCVFALAVMGSDLYVGGLFKQTADGTLTNLNNIARYSSGGTWSALTNNGLNGYVRALAVSGSDLYVGGGFTQTADGTVTHLNNIARNSSGGTWSALTNNGLNNAVYALAVMGSDLYVGGGFTQTADGTMKLLNKIARYSGGSTWSALTNNGLGGSYSVEALAVIGSDLYVGGWFTQTADGAVTNLNNIARYSGGAWSALPHNGFNEKVYALAVSGSDLYVGGWFTQTADGAVTNLNNIARYSGGAWSALPHNGFNDKVYALAVSGSDLYVGGMFIQTADGTVTNLNKIAKLGISVAPGHLCYLPLVTR
jgi:trimeric autotransporter adhesin